MTLVVALTINELPVLIGDVVLSGAELDRAISIPTIGDVSQIFPEGSGWTITELRQKINIIDRNLVIGWTGSYVAAKTIISELKRKSELELFTRKSLREFLEDKNTKEWIASQEVGFVGYIQDSEGIEAFNYSFNNCRCIKFKSHKYGDITLCGTGSSDMEKLIKKIVRRSSKVSKNLSKFDNVVIDTLSFCGWLFAYEMATYESLFQFYGGAYEIVTYVDDKFQKLEEITYLFWWIIPNKNTSIISQGFKVAYVNDILFVYTIEFDNSAESIYVNNENVARFGINDIKIHYVAPLYKNLDENTLIKIPGLNSKFNSNYLFFISNIAGVDNLDNIFCVPTQATNLESNPVRFIDEGKKTLLEVDISFLETLVNTANGSVKF